MVKEFFVEGISDVYDVEIIDIGIWFKIMIDMMMYGKVMYMVKILR